MKRRGPVAGKILRANLSEQTLEEESADRYEERFIGGRGINSWIVFKEIDSETKPLDPENVIAVGAGPLAGSSFPCSAYTSIASKNLNTGGVNWTHSGGYFASSLRHAGWSNIIITGKSERPVYIYINDGHAELRDAAAVWKKDVWETQDKIIAELKDQRLRFATIGTAGANVVPSACVITDRTRSCANGGIGAIFGSKNLKCISVRGNDESVIELIHKIAKKDGFGELLGKGTVKASGVVGKGSDYYSTALKGQDNLDALRACKAWCLGNAASLRGGKHLDGAPASEVMGLPPALGEKLFGIPTAGNPVTYEGKGKLVALHTMYKSAIDTLGVF